MLDYFQSIPSEVLVGLVSAAFSGWQRLQTMKLEQMQVMANLQLQAHASERAALEEAAKRDNTDWGKAARRLGFLLCMFYVFGFPCIAGIASIWMDSPATYYLYPQEGHGFWFWRKGASMHYEVLFGFVITPLQSHLASMFGAYYLGASMVGRLKK